MKRKIKRYEDGGDVPEGGRFAESDPDIYTRARKWMESQSSEETAKPSKAAGKPAVKSGAKVTRTQTAKASDTTPTAKVGTGSGRGRQGGPTTEELEYEREVGSIGKGKVVPPSKKGVDTEEIKRQAFNTAMALPGLQGLKPAIGAARTARSTALATRGYDKITPIPNRAARSTVTGIEDAGRASGPGLTSSPARVRGPSEPERLSVKKSAPRLEATRTKKRAAEESDVGFRKGGNVTTSRRGDGIAQRGKTKGRMI